MYGHSEEAATLPLVPTQVRRETKRSLQGHRVSWLAKRVTSFFQKSRG